MGIDTPELARISDYVFHYAERTPAAEAAVLRDTRWSYAELAGQIELCARALRAASVKKGDRVAMLATPRPEFLLVLLAAADIGAIWVGLHPRYQLLELRYVVDQARPALLFAFSEIDDRSYTVELNTLRNEFDCITDTILLDEGAGLDAFLERGRSHPEEDWRSARAAVQIDDTAAIIFTSGTTGAPKGAMIKHYGLIYGAQVESRRWRSKGGLRLLNNLPNNHIAGLGMLSVFAMVVGGAIVFMDRFDAKASSRSSSGSGLPSGCKRPPCFISRLLTPSSSDSTSRQWNTSSGPVPPCRAT